MYALKILEQRLITNLNYIFLAFAVASLDPIYPIALVIGGICTISLIITNTIRYRTMQIVLEWNRSDIGYSMTMPGNIVYMFDIMAVVMNTTGIIIICCGPYYKTPFYVSIQSYILLALSLLIDYMHLYIYSYIFYKTQQKTESEKVVNNLDILADYSKSSEEPSISGFNHASSISSQLETVDELIDVDMSIDNDSKV